MNSVFSFDSTSFSLSHSTVGGKMADEQVIKMMNPMNYIDSPDAVKTRNWRIRHGMVDRDTSLAIPLMLALKLQNAGFSVDFAYPWGVAHAGDYDLDELFGWIEKL